MAFKIKRKRHATLLGKRRFRNDGVYSEGQQISLHDHGQSEGEKRTRKIDLRTYDDRRGTPDGKQCDSDKRRKNCSGFHDEKTVINRVCAEEIIVIDCCRVRELKSLRHGEGFFICRIGG